MGRIGIKVKNPNILRAIELIIEEEEGYKRENWIDYEMEHPELNHYVLYVAYKFKNGEINAMVFIIDILEDEVMVKPMHEGMCPLACNVSEEFISKLTPTKSEYANKWRGNR